MYDNIGKTIRQIQRANNSFPTYTCKKCKNEFK